MKHGSPSHDRTHHHDRRRFLGAAFLYKSRTLVRPQSSQIISSSLMHEAHRRYWDHAAETFRSVLRPSLQADHSLRALTQWKRSPWAIRKLEQDSADLSDLNRRQHRSAERCGVSSMPRHCPVVATQAEGGVVDVLIRRSAVQRLRDRRARGRNRCRSIRASVSSVQ